MLKNIIIFITLVTTNLFATQPIGMYYNENNHYISIYPSQADSQIQENNNDWVGVYRSGDSNDWNNMVKWVWVKNLETFNYTSNGIVKEAKKVFINGQSESLKEIDTVDELEPGNYQLRYFLNNSYTTYYALDFSIGANITVASKTPSSLTLNSTYKGDQSWIGIYAKGDPNDWNNVKAWSWVTQTETSLNISNLSSGEYEAKLFYNNSYDLEASVGFSIIENDENYLFQNLDTTIGDGVNVKNNGNSLMSTGMGNFVTVNNNNLKLENMKVTDVVGGFDLEFDITNQTNAPEDLTFKIEIGGIHFGSNGTLNILDTQTYLAPRLRTFDEGEISRINLSGADDDISYPKGYSPVIVAYDENFAVGASILTSYNEDEIALEQFVSHNSIGNWSFVFENVPSNQGQNAAGVNRYSAKKLVAYESQNFKIAVRFTNISGDKEKNWKYTLAPYKTFFNNRFSNKHIVEKDTSPILGMTFSWIGAAKEAYKNNENNELALRGYMNSGASFSNADDYAEQLSSVLNDNNHQYKRVMFWGVSGQYTGYNIDTDYDKFNLPPQFMTVLPAIDSVLNNVQDKLEDLEIDYGFWWGRSGQIPIKDGRIMWNGDWNADDIISSNIDSPNGHHLNFTTNELQKALDRGSKEIGLDAFSNMELSAQFNWLREIKTYANNQGKEIKLMQEGIMCDYLHTETSLFLQPNNDYFHIDTNGEPIADYQSTPVLADYLNSNAEIIVWLQKSRHKNKDYIDKLIGFGFTPLIEVKDGYPNKIPVYY
ncbi:MAG: hypothetical protein K0U47_09365 [Epsilonproteobacteria bacterium]|nr:hypothetical protein [Campylobacterota bacterium]